MIETVSPTSGRGVLRPRARILRTFGDELISSETVGVIELVKNAYDADATRVVVRFEAPLQVGQGKIEVLDNGHGMSLDTIKGAWMEPATLVRMHSPRSEKRRRRVLGEKGIGRFAASRLAACLEVVTRRAGMTREIRVFFDWSQFDDDRKYLDQIEVPWEEVEPREICLGGSIMVLWQGSDKPNPSEPIYGTIMRMQGLRTTWGRDQFVGLRTGLSRLISPFIGRGDTSPDGDFQIGLQLPPPFDDLSGWVGPPEALRSPHYSLQGHVDKTGHYDLTVRLRGDDREKSITGQFTPPDGRTPQCGPFDVELRVWDRDQTSMYELAQDFGATLSDVRRDLDSAAGINIYRDGFRVLPYGEPGNDWLRLDSRRVQNPTLRLSNNQVVGYVLISADDNPLLRDQSNREGLIEGPALHDLRELIIKVLAELESRRYDVRPRREKPMGKPGGLFTDFDIAGIHERIRQSYPDDTELLTLVGEKSKDLERRVEEVQEVVARYRRLATLGQLIDTVLHDGRAPLSKIGNEAHLALRGIKRASRDAKKLIRQLEQRLGAIHTQSGVLATVFRKIEPFGGRRRGRPVPVALEKAIADAFSVLDSEIAEIGAKVTLPTSDTKTTADQAEIQEVIINLLQNSLYWLREVPKTSREIAVSVNRKSPDEVRILFSDSGPGVEPEFRERIFDPYFSTKPDGVGLGLTIAGEIVSEYYAGELVLLDHGPLPGATFRITLCRRV